MNVLKIARGGGRLTTLLSAVCCITAAVAGSGSFDDFNGTDVSVANTEWNVSQHVNTPVYTSGAVLTEAMFDARSATVSTAVSESGLSTKNRDRASSSPLPLFRSDKLPMVIHFR